MQVVLSTTFKVLRVIVGIEHKFHVLVLFTVYIAESQQESVTVYPGGNLFFKK